VQSERRLDRLAAGAGPAGDGPVAQLLANAVLAEAPDASVLDCGGGSGRFAVPLAALGASVTVVDVSVDALATLRRRAIEAGVAERIVPVQGDVEALPEAIGTARFDLVLAHGILEAVGPVPETFRLIAAAVRPGGRLSVLVANPVATLLARALAGDLPGAERELAQLDAERTRSGPEAVRRLCAEHGLVVEQVHGVGVFRDLVPGAALDLPGALDALARLEAACARRSPFAEIAGSVHVLARARAQ
jgi:S-adenosylmethionine-dependent methyltransferase